MMYVQSLKKEFLRSYLTNEFNALMTFDLWMRPVCAIVSNRSVRGNEIGTNYILVFTAATVLCWFSCKTDKRENQTCDPWFAIHVTIHGNWKFVLKLSFFSTIGAKLSTKRRPGKFFILDFLKFTPWNCFTTNLALLSILHAMISLLE